METVLLYILGIVIAVVGLVVSIGLHEVGHLVPAKLFGVRVGQYMIGFGRTIWSVKRGETEYGFKAIPLGGYISMAGMYPPAKNGALGRTASTGFFQTMVQDARDASADTVEDGEEHRTFYGLAVWKRIIIMLGGPFMNLVIAVVLFAVVLSGFGTPQLSTTIGSVSECLLPVTSTATTCAPTDPVAPAAAAGILPGDRLVSFDGNPITEWGQASAIIQESPGTPLRLVVQRDGKDVTLTVIPALTARYVVGEDGKVMTDADNKPITKDVGMLGITSATENVPQPLTAVLPAVGNNIVAVGNIILHLPQRMVDVWNAAFSSQARDPNGPVGIVGIGRIAGEITSINTVPVADKASSLIGLIASLNVALLVFNLIPLMPLDGGHVAGALWEGIRRFFAKLFKRRDPGPVDVAKLVPLTMIVVLIFGAMSLLLVYADIVKPITLF